ncbi:hypothetical protein ACFL6U_28440 [Planctomycetota bacterium]
MNQSKRSVLLTVVLVLLTTLAASAKHSGGTGGPNDPHLIATATGFKSETIEDVTVMAGLVTEIDLSMSFSELVLDSVYPTLGQLGEELEVVLTGDGFDEHTRVSISPDVGNKKAIIGFQDTPGSACDIVLSGTTAYIADRHGGLRILDVSDPTSPLEIGFVDTPGEAWGVAVSGSITYVADGENGLQVIDVDNPAIPKIIGDVDTPDFAHDVAVSGTTVYMADCESGLQIIDVGNPAQPTITGFYDTPGEALDIVIIGSHAYVADSYGGLQIINVSSPSAPFREGSIDHVGAYASGLFVDNTTLYLANSYRGLYFVDVADPANPKIIRTIDTPAWAQDVIVAGTFAYVADGQGGLQIIDISTPEIPTIVGLVNTPGDGLAISLSGNNVFMADGYSGLQVIDVNNPSSLFIGSASTSTWAQGIAISGTYAYVTEGGALGPGVTTVDISDPFNPVVVNELDANYFYGIDIQDNYAYIAGSSDGLIILDITLKAAPQIAGTYDSPGNPIDVAVSGTIVGLPDGPALQIIDISKPENPIFITALDPDPASDSDVRGIAASGTTMCITGDAAAGMRIVDVSKPHSPVMSSKIDVGYANTVLISGDYAYVGGYNKLSVVDINPLHTDDYMTIIAVINTAGGAADMTITGNYIYLANDGQGLQVVDVTIPFSPVTIGSVGTFSLAKDVAVSGNVAFVADYYSGLVILPVPMVITQMTVNTENEMSVTIPQTNIAGPYTLTVFNDVESSELFSAVTFTADP